MKSVLRWLRRLGDHSDTFNDNGTYFAGIFRKRHWQFLFVFLPSNLSFFCSLDDGEGRLLGQNKLQRGEVNPVNTILLQLIK